MKKSTIPIKNATSLSIFIRST